MLSLRRGLGILLALLLTVVSADGTPAGTLVTNQASASFIRATDVETTLSDKVETRISSVCNVSILPNGTVGAPAYTTILERTGSTYFAYDLTNTGNDNYTFDLITSLENESTLTPDALEVVWDQNGNEKADAGEPTVTELSLGADESASLLLAVTLNKVDGPGNIYVNLTGVCAGDAATNFASALSDANNVSHLVVPLLGFTDPIKSSEPEPGSTLYPGATVNYAIAFRAKSDLVDVVVEDTLNENFGAPLELSDGLIEDPETGLRARVTGSYDELTRTVTWRFDSLPEGMNVKLNLTTKVRSDLEDLPPETNVTNTATVSSGTVTETASNTVTHDLRPVVIDLDKTASPSQVGIGDTLSYTLKVSNPPTSVILKSLDVTDILPEVLEYKPGTSSVTFSEDSEDTGSENIEGEDIESENLEPDIDGQKLVWRFGEVNPGDSITIRFETTVLSSALYTDEIENIAEALAEDAGGQAVADAAATAATVVDLGVFEQRATLLGTAFVDSNDNGLFDQETESVVEGLRLYLNDGSSTVTDEFGRYTFQNLDPALSALRVDMTTAPSRFFRETPSEDKEGLWRVRLSTGVITRQDIPFVAPQVALEVAQFLTVTRGPLEVEKRVLKLENGFEVHLTLSSREALKNVMISDLLPAGAALLSPPSFADGSAVPANGLELQIGDVPAGLTKTVRYKITFEGPLENLLNAPDLSWDVR